jgi:hypothetical protein
MAPLVEPAVPTLLTSISTHHIGKKLRVVGTYATEPSCTPIPNEPTIPA